MSIAEAGRVTRDSIYSTNPGYVAFDRRGRSRSSVYCRLPEMVLRHQHASGGKDINDEDI